MHYSLSTQIIEALEYQTYYDLLINACGRYDRTKKAKIRKEATSIKLQHTMIMMDLQVEHHLKLHGEIHLRVWTTLVTSFITSIQPMLVLQ